jgi:ubiquinone/menaquinone biosynthesis C-methylase UbiE
MSYRLVEDPNTDTRAIVREGYDRCAADYAAARAADPERELEQLDLVLVPGVTALDIGCGAGVPVTAFLARRADVVGVDLSAVMLEEARRNVPKARFILGDVMDLDFPKETFDVVTAWYSLFHVPRERHTELLAKVHRWLKPGGCLLATLAANSLPGYTEDDFFGVRMYWSHYKADWYLEHLAGLGFRVAKRGVIGHGYRDTSAPPERHPYVLAVRAE